ncbi:MAG: hypothetical protein B6D44_04590 [Ignavibacteriales bacterium UTCHB2]|jgi:glycosyltransferase involved in cell wall biosynthesis|nr:MAG: hypothetical protein B6D44_04590 [Ignavibacteriales bacterium UTCHB2]HQI40847.1 glycosyltransferase family 2 protein [Ignavibacteriaceae bacterium]
MSETNKLKISIVTPSLNQGEYIEQTIKSVLNQDYNNYEHIIIDGASEDKTIEILNKYKHLRWISEKDKGQSNAINKGLYLATGDIFAWLNSDDYYENNIFLSVAEYFTINPDCDFLYGDITYVDKNSNILFKISGDSLNYKSLLINPDLIRQPSFFWRREAFLKFGGVDESLNLVMDYDIFLKFTKSKTAGYLNKNLSYYRTYSDTKTLKFRKKQAIEIYKVLKRNNSEFSIKIYWFLFKRYFGLFPFFSRIGKLWNLIFNYGKK